MSLRELQLRVSIYADLYEQVAVLLNTETVAPRHILQRCACGFDYLNDHRGRLLARAALRARPLESYQQLLCQLHQHLTEGDLFNPRTSPGEPSGLLGYQFVCRWLQQNTRICQAHLEHTAHLQLQTAQVIYPRLTMVERLGEEFGLALELQPANDGGWYQISPIQA